MIGATRGPSDSAVGRAREPEGHGFTEISEAGEVGRVAIRAEGDAGIATEVIGAGPRHGGVVRELGDARDEAGGAEGRDGGFAAGGNEDYRCKDRSVTHRVLQKGNQRA